MDHFKMSCDTFSKNLNQNMICLLLLHCVQGLQSCYLPFLSFLKKKLPFSGFRYHYLPSMISQNNY